MAWHIKTISHNLKTGPIAVTTHERSTCPDSCGLKDKGCYAELGPLYLHWQKVSEGDRGTDFDQFLRELRALPRKSKLRLAQAGDLPQKNGHIDRDRTIAIAKAVRHLETIAYTHHALNSELLETIAEARRYNLVINVSADSPIQAARIKRDKKSLNVVTVLPISAPNVQTIDGVKIVACPAEKTERINCSNCMLCAKNRDYVIGFRAHGIRKKKVQKLIETITIDM
jgi:hypothetical protein